MKKQKQKVWSLRQYTGTLVEKNVLGELLARMLGFVDGRTLLFIEKCTEKECKITGFYNADMKLVFGIKRAKLFSVYVNEKAFKAVVKSYFKLMFYSYHGKQLWNYANSSNNSNHSVKEELVDPDGLPF